MCLNTDIARQFEFIQQTWLLNTDFATLFERNRPAGRAEGPDDHPRGATAPDRARRDLHPNGRRGYFFLPSIPALRYLAML